MINANANDELFYSIYFCFLTYQLVKIDRKLNVKIDCLNSNEVLRDFKFKFCQRKLSNTSGLNA
jgi:hypothetical protein